MILVDTGGLLAAYDRLDPDHAAAAPVLERDDRRVLSPFVLAELGYMVARNLGAEAERALLAEVCAGVYQLEAFDSADVGAARAVIDRYPTMNLGLADASIVVLAERHHCHDVLTLDERHFRNLRTRSGRSFRLLPRDAVS